MVKYGEAEIEIMHTRWYVLPRSVQVETQVSRVKHCTLKSGENARVGGLAWIGKVAGECPKKSGNGAYFALSCRLPDYPRMLSKISHYVIPPRVR